jgi:SAM-dependent methyltransferase
VVDVTRVAWSLAMSLFGIAVLAAPAVAGGGTAQEERTRRHPTRTPDVVYSPTRHAVALAMLDLAGVTPDDVVYDLGSGDGRIVILAAQRFGARGVGIEIEPRLVEISRHNARDAEVADRVRFLEGDLFTAEIAEATVVTLYLSPSVNARLESKLRRELRPGTRVVSHRFRIGHWPPERTETTDDGTALFLWTIPAR